MSNWKTRPNGGESCLVTRQVYQRRLYACRAQPPDWKSHLVSQARNSGKLAGKPQVDQDQLEICAGNLQAPGNARRDSGSRSRTAVRRGTSGAASTATFRIITPPYHLGNAMLAVFKNRSLRS